MRKHFRICSLTGSLLISALCQSQSDLVWSAPSGTWANASAANGDLLSAHDNTLFRLDANGSLIWAITYNEFQRIRAILELASGELIVAGSMADSTSLVVGLMRTTSIGSVVWARALISDTIPPSFGGTDFSTTLLRAGSTGFILHDTYGSERRLSRFNGNGFAVWSRLYYNGNFIRGLAVDGSHDKLFAVDGSDVYRFDMLDGHEVWHAGLGLTGTVVTIACNGDRLGVGYTGPGADGAIALLDTTGALLGAREWDDTFTTQGNNRIVAHGSAFTMASGSYWPGGFGILLFTVDTALTNGQVLSTGNQPLLHVDASTTAGDAVLLTGTNTFVRVDPLAPGSCFDTLPLPPYDPVLSGATTSLCVYSPSVLTTASRAITVQPGTVAFGALCISTDLSEGASPRPLVVMGDALDGRLVLRHPAETVRLSIHDPRGSTVAIVPADRSGTTVIPTGDLAAGAYSILACDMSNAPIGSARFAVVR